MNVLSTGVPGAYAEMSSLNLAEIREWACKIPVVEFNIEVKKVRGESGSIR